MSERERQLVAALWKQTDELLVRTRRQIEALSARDLDRGEPAQDVRDSRSSSGSRRGDEPRLRF